MSSINSTPGDAAGDNNSDDKLGKLPFKTLTIHPRDELRIRILLLKQQLGIKAAAAAERLLCLAAEVKIPWMIIKPQNGATAGVTFAQVEKVMMKTFNVLNHGVGVFYRLNANEKAKQLEMMRDGALELWRGAQMLAKETFYSPDEFRQMCACYDFVGASREQLTRQMEDEGKKERPDAAKIAIWTKRIAGYEATEHVLKRLGCGGSYDAI
jgi:hypothetical protein